MSVQGKPSGVGRKLRRFLILCGLGILGLPGIASAAIQEYRLSDLLPGGNQAAGFTIGDKHYSNFQFLSSTGPRALTPADVNVRVTSSDANPAVPGDDRYNLQYFFGMDVLPGEFRHDLVLQYDVAVTDPLQFIDRLGLGFNGDVNPGVGSANTAVVERAWYLNGSGPNAQVIGDPLIMMVQNDGRGLNQPQNDLAVSMPINPARFMRFEKDIIVTRQINGGYAVISVVDNMIDQNIPEPSMLGLAVFAGGGLLLRRRR